MACSDILHIFLDIQRLQCLGCFPVTIFDLEEPYILPNNQRFGKMCTTGSLGDYLGLPTFGTNYYRAVKLTDKPCSPDSRLFSTSSIDSIMNLIRDDIALSSSTCSSHFNYNNKGTVIFDTDLSATAIPSSVSQVGFDVSLVGGSADAFVGSRGYIVHLSDDGSYNRDYPITITKSADGVVGAAISSVDVGDLGNVQGGFRLVLAGMSTSAIVTGKQIGRAHV